MMHSWGEYVTVPNMNYILLSLLPLILVRKSGFPSLAAANGQFMLFNAATYKAMQPHEKMKASKVEDIETAKYFKQNKIKVACLAGNQSIRCKMYEGFSEAVNGFSKNVIMFFGNSFLWAILFWTITSLGFIFVIMSLSIKLACIYFLFLILTRISVSVASKQNIFINLLLAFPQQLIMGLFIYKAIINQSKKAFEWKGRKIA
jgi:chlorobactene glucosyltransferase